MNFFSALEIALLSNSKLFFVQPQMFDRGKIYLNVGYFISLHSALILNTYAPLWAFNIAIWFQYDEYIRKVLLRFDLTTCHACAQGENQFLAKHGKGKKNPEKQTSIAFMTSFYHLKAYKEDGGSSSHFLQFNTHHVKGPLRMLSPGSKIWEKGTFTFGLNVLVGNVALFVLYALLIAKYVRHICCICLLCLSVLINFHYIFIFLFFWFFCFYIYLLL